MTGATRAFALMLFVLAAIACGAERHPPPDGTSRSAIVNGTPITSTADVEKLGVAWVVVPPSSGSGILLSNEWVLTAAHVIAGAVPSSVSVTLGDPSAVPPAQTKFADALVFHPRSPTSSLDGDMALVHVNPPFLLDGSLTTRRRAITNRDTSMFWGSLGRCYGYGRPSLTGTPGPPPRTANFLMEPYLPNPSITFAFSVYKGGGSTPSGTGSGVLPVQGDSGGPCLDALAPAGFEPVMGIMTSVDSASDPQFSIYLAAEAFRDFARAVITTATPPIQFDIDGDGLLETLFVRYQSGQYWFEIQWGTGAPAIKFPPTGIPQLGLGLNRAFVASSDANGDGNPDLVDFNGDGVGDFLGSINGTT